MVLYLYYKDLIKKEFIKSYPIYARNLNDLKTKVKSDNGVWLIFDGKKYGKLSSNLKRRTTKSTKKRSGKYSGSKKLGGIPYPKQDNSLINSIANHYGKH